MIYYLVQILIYLINNDNSLPQGLSERTVLGALSTNQSKPAVGGGGGADPKKALKAASKASGAKPGNIRRKVVEKEAKATQTDAAAAKADEAIAHMTKGEAAI